MGEGESAFGLVQAALTVDGLSVIEAAVAGMLENNSDIFRWIFRRGELYNLNRTKGIPCTTTPPTPWMFGPSLMDMIKQRKPKGLSGNLTFDDNGFRRDYSLGVFSMALDEGVQQIASSCVLVISSIIKQQLMTSSYRFSRHLVLTQTEPFLMKAERKDGEPVLMGNKRFKGFAMDLATDLAAEVGFTFLFRVVKDGSYGSQLPGNHSWNGMMGELIRKEAELAVAPLTITADRERYVDFSKPFMEIGATIMIKKPQSTRPGVFSFMEPLSVEVWVCIIVAYLIVSIALFLVSRFSPLEWRKVKEEGDSSYHNDFSLYNSFWFSMGALMFQGSDTCPRSVSGRIIGGAWWFFVLIIISSYTANLAAFLTIERMISPIESADDLLNHPTMKYGAVISGSTLQFFLKSDVPVYKQMGGYMMSNKEVLVKSNDEGVQRVLDSKGKYAFIAESSVVDYVNNRMPCDTTSVGGALNNKGYGVATSRNSELRDPINVAVLKLKEEGRLYTLHQEWWVEKGQCGGAHGGKQKVKLSLTLSNVAGIFYILIVGLVLAIIQGVFEFMCFRAKHKSEDTVTGDGYLKGTSTQSTLCNTPNDREDGMLPYELHPTQNSSDNNAGYIGFEKFYVDRGQRYKT
ncbi:glutamate receptor 1 [Aplysia californica]|uniref:Glutamate receptor 1 n=1 Tax=Aplysia californica TaxID=6500 RepID=A0ABM1ACE8_APLCA|nr:glutamate receptor 1 [Aplysia californica]